MQDIEPFYRWRDEYIASEDEASPLYGYENSEHDYTHQIYNYLIHPQWDELGSDTLYFKILFVDYDLHYCIIEFIGEWNDAITNDIMHLKRNIIDNMMTNGINRFIFATENILNFHGSDDCYYEEWYEDIVEQGGWVCYLNTQSHVANEMEQFGIQQYVALNEPFDDVVWRNKKPEQIFSIVESLLGSTTKQLYY